MRNIVLYRYTVFMVDVLKQRLHGDGRIEFMVRIRPNAPQSRFVSALEDGSLKLDIAAPAEDGKGNVALVKLLSSLFEVSAAQVKILSGKAARLKLVRITVGSRQ